MSRYRPTTGPMRRRRRRMGARTQTRHARNPRHGRPSGWKKPRWRLTSRCAPSPLTRAHTSDQWSRPARDRVARALVRIPRLAARDRRARRRLPSRRAPGARSGRGLPSPGVPSPGLRRREERAPLECGSLRSALADRELRHVRGGGACPRRARRDDPRRPLVRARDARSRLVGAPRPRCPGQRAARSHVARSGRPGEAGLCRA